MGDYRYNPVDPVHNAHLLAGESSVFDRIGIGVPDADQALEVSGIVHISAEQGTTPAAPANGDGGLFYTKADGKPYWRSNDVAETDLSSGGGSGDITSVVAGAGLTGGALTGDATLNVVGGDGITANADEIEVTVDDSTIERSASDGTGAIRVKDTGITNAKMAANSVDSDQYVDNSIDTAHIADDQVTYAKIQNVSATNRILGRDSASAGVIEEITPANLRTMINVADGATAGGGIAFDGSTAQGVCTYKDSDEATVESNLTFDGNSLLVITGSASAVPCTIKGAGSQSAHLVSVQDSSGNELLMIDEGGSIRLGLSGDREVHVSNESGTNRAGKDIFIKGGKSTGSGEGGDVRFYTSPAGSSGVGVNNWTEALKIRHDNVVDFKITAATKTGSSTISTDFMSTAEINPSKWLEIKIAGTQYFLPAFASGQFA